MRLLKMGALIICALLCIGASTNSHAQAKWGWGTATTTNLQESGVYSAIVSSSSQFTASCNVGGGSSSISADVHLPIVWIAGGQPDGTAWNTNDTCTIKGTPGNGVKAAGSSAQTDNISISNSTAHYGGAYNYSAGPTGSGFTGTQPTTLVFSMAASANLNAGSYGESDVSWSGP